MTKAKEVLERLFAQDDIVPTVPPTDLCGVESEGAERGGDGAVDSAPKVNKLHVVTVGNKEWPELEVHSHSCSTALLLS
jgi:hypothetical protein